MRITHIEASASRTFNHPTEKFANFRFSIKLGAELLETDNILTESDFLRQTVEAAAENHKQQILTEIRNQSKREYLMRTIARARRAPAVISDATAKLECQGMEGWRREDLEDQIKSEEEGLLQLPKLLQDLEAIPAPRLLPLPEIHPGHPDHPATDFAGGIY